MEVTTNLPHHIQPAINDIDERIFALKSQLIPTTATEVANLEFHRGHINKEIQALSAKKAELYQNHSTYSVIVTEEEYSKYLKSNPV